MTKQGDWAKRRLNHIAKLASSLSWPLKIATFAWRERQSTDNQHSLLAALPIRLWSGPPFLKVSSPSRCCKTPWSVGPPSLASPACHYGQLRHFCLLSPDLSTQTTWREVYNDAFPSFLRSHHRYLHRVPCPSSRCVTRTLQRSLTFFCSCSRFMWSQVSKEKR